MPTTRMCGRFILGESSWAEYHESLSILRPEPAKVSYNIRPTQSAPIAYYGENGLLASNARSWFVPHWHKGEVKDWKATTFNAKIETAHEKPAFRTAWKTGRCLIPASGYYEWTGEKGKKQPWFIGIETNAPVFYFAGLRSKLADDSETCTILTRASAPQIDHLHARHSKPRPPIAVAGR